LHPDDFTLINFSDLLRSTIVAEN